MTTALTAAPMQTPRSLPRPSALIATLATLVFLAAVLVVGPASADAQAVDEISPQGVGSAVIGSTRTQLEAQLGPSYSFGPATEVLVDVKGYEVSRGGVAQFIAASAVGTGDLTPDTPLDVFLIRQAGVTTAAGIGVGSTIDEGVAAYGAATISFNTENESREFARFENQPPGLNFRTGSGATAGIYPASSDSFMETMDFIGDAEIQAVWISCGNVVNPCPPQPTLPDTGATHSVLLAISGLLATAGFVLVHFERRVLA